MQMCWSKKPECQGKGLVKGDRGGKVRLTRKAEEREEERHLAKVRARAKDTVSLACVGAASGDAVTQCRHSDTTGPADHGSACT